MDADEAERLFDTLAELAGTGPSMDPRALVEARAILRRITQSAPPTAYVRERADEVDRALTGWFDSDERFHRLLKRHCAEIQALIDRLHSAVREASRFRTR